MTINLKMIIIIQPSTRSRKAIGDWGEAVANDYLKLKEYPSSDGIWLNKNGIGKGCDFLIKKNGD